MKLSKLETLRKVFEKPGISLDVGPGPFTTVTLEHDGASCQVCTHGAHVLGYQPRNQARVLWLSPHAFYEANRAIRGGIPICWPWFAEHARNSCLPAHGFARVAEWAIVESVSSDEVKSVTLALRDSVGTRAMWPHAFELRYRVSVSAHFSASLNVTNSGVESMRFTGALHSYFDVQDVGRVSLDGLAGCSYLDKVDDNRRKLQSEPLLRFTSEVDRIYVHTGERCTINDEGRGRRLQVLSSGSRSTVVWNPWHARARQLADFPDDGYRRMVCVETANAAGDFIDLVPGTSHTLSVCIESTID